ncbi:hypothetical protein PFISCL1PPCAC_3342 [Pristionchus fissidentatus]|uniref:protein-tyrosine-phosphatase n=1 Tax=Pristionchus fissidentatus TaxID=1538716 RepID=A0AAV5V2N4_9BILA|nr:hypothetical protein PFISCL1PPCAC_3342 [Pristionchus fissidentatus]
MQSFPHKLRMGKKSGSYDLSQDIYVLTVCVGDTPFIQCTLTTPSTAIQCLQYISHKMQLGQIEMFGLRFQMRTNDPDDKRMRWVELDKPLRRQLDKWACKPWENKVQLAVIYHTPNTFSLTDHMARSYYFLMMKLEIIEGRMTVDLEKNITLAAYSLQVEYGDFDPQTHTIDFLQSIPLLPKEICRSAHLLGDQLQKVLMAYASMRGHCTRDTAAVLYITDAIQSEGYGEEYFKAKDEDSSEVRVGYAPHGIIVGGSYGAPIKYMWHEIREITARKRHLLIKLLDDRTVEYTLESAEWSRYVVMVLQWQWRHASSKAIEMNRAPVEFAKLQGGIKTPVPHASSSSHLAQSTTDVHQLSISAARSQSSLLATRAATSMMDMVTMIEQHNGRGSYNKPPLSSVSFNHHAVQGRQFEDRQRASSTGVCTSTQYANIIQNPMWQPSTSSAAQTISESGSSSMTPLTRSELDVGQRVLATTEPPRMTMGSSPEMRVLGVHDARRPPAPAVPRLTEIVDSPYFQSTPNLMAAHQARPSGSRDHADYNFRSSNGHVDSLRINRALSDRQHNRVKSPEVAPRLPSRPPAMTISSISSAPHQRDVREEDQQQAAKVASSLALPLDSLRTEFAKVPARRVSAGTSTSMRPENQCRNRTRAIVPYEDSRVSLTPTKSNPYGYVNASHVEIVVGPRRHAFILAQAPLRDTIDDFWSAVWQKDVRVIVMLSEVTLDGSSNNPIYWPLTTASKVETREVVVKFKTVTTTNNEVTTTLELRCRASGERRTVFHMRYADWPTGGTPEDERDVLAFMDSVRCVQRHVETERRSEQLAKEEGRSRDKESAAARSKRSSSRSGVRTLADVSNRIRSQSVEWRRRLSSATSSSVHSAASSSSSASSTDSGAPPSPSPHAGAAPPLPLSLPATPAAAAAVPPLMISCFTGSHESGTFLLAEIALLHQQHNIQCELSPLLHRLRAQRMGLVKTVEQYRFVYLLLAAAQQQCRLI